MSPEARLYRAEIIRAAFGERAHECKVADMHRLNQICEHLATCEEAQTIIRAKGHGTAGMSFVELARSVPDNVREKLKRFFGAPPAARCPDLGEADTAWSRQ
jgi:hypothetical protein